MKPALGASRCRMMSFGSRMIQPLLLCFTTGMLAAGVSVDRASQRRPAFFIMTSDCISSSSAGSCSSSTSSASMSLASNSRAHTRPHTRARHVLCTGSSSTSVLTQPCGTTKAFDAMGSLLRRIGLAHATSHRAISTRA